MKHNNRSIHTFLGSGNSIDPKLIFISFDPTGEWLWDYIADLDGQIEEIQNKFIPLIDFALSLRRKGSISREEEELERPRWNQSVTVRVELEMNIIHTFFATWPESIIDQYYYDEYRKNELSLSFFPIAPGWRQTFSPFLKEVFSLPENQSEYYDLTYSIRAILLSKHISKVFKNTKKPVVFIFLPIDILKRKYLLNWVKEMGFFTDILDLSQIAIANHNGTIWLIPDADSAEVDYEKLRDTILHILSNKNPILLSQLKAFYETSSD
jgi:hypothetical protein